MRTFRSLLVLGFCLAAAAAGAAPRPPAKATHANAAPASAPAAAAGFDARDPASLIALLGPLGATAAIDRSEQDAVYLKVSTPAYAFGAQYAGCNDRRRACRAVAFSSRSDQRTATLAQLNAFNQTSLICRVYQDPAGQAHVMYAALLSQADTAETMKAHLAAWQGCLASFGEFLRDPTAYLASAP